MIRSLGAVLTVLMLSACQTSPSIVSDEVSEGGANYSLVTMPGNSRVSVKVAWANPWVSDASNNQAVPYIGTRLLLAGGAKDYPAGLVVEQFTDMNSEGDLAPTVEYVIGTLHYSPEHQEETLKLVNAHLQSPAMDEQWLDRIRGEFSDQMKEQRGSPGSQGFNAMRWAVFGKQNIRSALSLDVPDMIEQVTQAEVVTWAEKVLHQKPVSIAIAGDLNSADAGSIVDALFEGLDGTDVVQPIAVDADFSPKRILMHIPDSEISTLSFVAQLPSSKEGGEFEDILLATALGGGAESVLFKTVRGELGASYRYGAGIGELTSDYRFLLLNGQVEDSKIDEAEKLILQAYANFRKAGPDGDLQQRKAPFNANIEESMKDTGMVSQTALAAKLMGQSSSRALNLEAELDAVTDEDLKLRLITAFPEADDFIVVVSSPNADALKDACVITSPEQAVDC